jgi:hypothetical protein
MGPEPVPTRITIDFRDSMHPSRTWILGLGTGSDRAELLAFGPEPTRTTEPRPAMRRVERTTVVRREATVTWAGGCTCPEFCERDHANE